MTKKEAISVTTRCAKLYAANLCDKQLAFLYRDSSNKVHIVEVIFRANNFMHLTGIETKQHQTAGSFYRDAIEQRLKESNLFFKDAVYSELTYQSKSIELTRKCLPNSFINKVKPELFGL